jgi:hypothetical protein
LDAMLKWKTPHKFCLNCFTCCPYSGPWPRPFHSPFKYLEPIPRSWVTTPELYIKKNYNASSSLHKSSLKTKIVSSA